MPQFGVSVDESGRLPLVVRQRLAVEVKDPATEVGQALYSEIPKQVQTAVQADPNIAQKAADAAAQISAQNLLAPYTKTADLAAGPLAPYAKTVDLLAQATRRINEAETARALADFPLEAPTADQPVITWGTPGNVTGFTRAGYQAADTYSRFVGVPDDNTTFGYRGNKVNNNSVGLTAEEFTYDGDTIRYEWRAVNNDGGSWQLYVDDRPIRAVPFKSGQAHSAGSIYYVQFAFPTARPRRIRIEYNIAQRYGVAFQTGKIMAPMGAGKPVACFLGDSYLTNSLGMAQHTSFPNRLARKLGWDVHNCGQGGSGYTSAGSGQTYANTDRLTAMMLANPDFVVVYGTVNVGSTTSASVFESAATIVFSKIAELRSSTKVIVVGPTRTPGDVPAAREAMRQGVRSAAANAANVVLFVDCILGEIVYAGGTVRGSRVPWNLGTGSTAQPVGDGNCDYTVGKDLVHPTDEGQRNIAGRLLPLLIEAATGYTVLANR